MELSTQERAEAAAERCESLKRLLRERLSALRPKDIEEMRSGEALEASVRDRLDEQRAERRRRFSTEVIRGIETKLGRELGAVERATVERANERYFATIDEAHEGETSREKRARIATAARERDEAISGLAGPAAEIAGLVAGAMNALE